MKSGYLLNKLWHSQLGGGKQVGWVELIACATQPATGEHDGWKSIYDKQYPNVTFLMTRNRKDELIFSFRVRGQCPSMAFTTYVLFAQ